MTVDIYHKPTVIRYPSTDGKPMASGTEQYDWIVSIKGNLDIVFDGDDEAFVGGDIFWYPVEGNNKAVVAPDVLVAIGRPRGKRDSYLQWKEGGVAPQVVFEVVSPGNSFQELADKYAFYERHGVEEYYLVRPDPPGVEGWVRRGDKLVPVERMDGWANPRLKVRFDLSTGDLTLYRPDGVRFLTHAELNARAENAQAEATEAKKQADDFKAEATEAKRLAEALKDEVAKEREAKERLAAKLRALGVDPETA